MPQTEFIDARDAYRQVSNGAALLVCAYERDDKFHRLHLEGALSLSEFQAQEGTVPRDTELIFY